MDTIISIITVSYNSAHSIKHTFDSVIKQNCPNIEHVIIDGNSNDGTLDIIKQYSLSVDYPVKIVSEPDRGIYDAMSKGIDLASGKYIQFLNSDDYYANCSVLRTVKQYLLHLKIYYGNTLFLERSDNKYKVGKDCSRVSLIKKPMCAIQPAIFVPKKFYNIIGDFNFNYSIAADYDMSIRLFKQFSYCYIPVDILYLNSGGKSDIESKECLKEMYKIAKNYTSSFNSTLFYLDRRMRLAIKKKFYWQYDKIRQFLKRK
jgi:glycosyltransferase involved in cell wall biosynthesis